MKNKTKDILLLFFILLVFNGGCVNDNMSSCLDDNMRLSFSLYSYPKDSARFMNRIRSVDVFVFDSDSFFVTSKRVTRTEMTRAGFIGTYLSLFPGNYLVACWANADSSTEISHMEKCETLLAQTFVSMSAVPGDSLYYAPARVHSYSGTGALASPGGNLMPDTLYSVEVAYGEQRQKAVEFIRAYRSINTFIKGYGGTKVDIRPPVVELSEISTLYDFEYHTIISTEKKSFTKTAQLATQNFPGIDWSPMVARFYTVFEKITNDIQVRVLDPATGQQLGFVRLGSYLEDHPEIDRDDIDILFEFTDNTCIGVTVPPWIRDEIDPQF
jgi:hypothetical protein